MEEKKDLIEKLKIAIFYGPNLVDGKNLNGQVEKIYKDEDDTAHFLYMQEFLQEHFKDDINVQESLKRRDINSIFYEIQKLGHICFAESTSVYKYKHDDQEPTYKKTGIFYIPKTISNKQKERLAEFQERLKSEDYHITELIGLERTEDGVLKGKADILDEFIGKSQGDFER